MKYLKECKIPHEEKEKNMDWESRKRVGVCRVRQERLKERKRKKMWKGTGYKKEKEIMKEDMNNVEKKKKKTNISLFPQKLLKVLLFRHKVTIRSNKFLSFKSLFIDEYSQI